MNQDVSDYISNNSLTALGGKLHPTRSVIELYRGTFFLEDLVVGSHHILDPSREVGDLRFDPTSPRWVGQGSTLGSTAKPQFTA